MTRRSKLTPEVHEAIIEMIASGNFRETAAANSGIDGRTLRGWLKRGADGEEPYAKFRDDLMKADALVEADVVDRIRKLGRRDWKALGWYAERKWPEKYGQKIKVHVTEELTRLLDVAERYLPPDQFVGLLEAYDAEARTRAVGEEASGSGPPQLPEGRRDH